MNGITDPAVEKYLYNLLPKRHPVLAEIERKAQRRNIPIVGPAVGRLFSLVAQMLGARRIFEMGSAVGYSTLWWAQAAGPGAEIYYSDGDPKNAEEARGYFERAGVADRIKVRVGNSLDLIQQVDGEFDIVFNDVDKHYYPEVFRLAVPRVRRGGLFVTDNVFWFGKVARKVRARDARARETRAIQQFNRLLYSSRELYPVLVPLRDGVALCRKL